MHRSSTTRSYRLRSLSWTIFVVLFLTVASRSTSSGSHFVVGKMESSGSKLGVSGETRRLEETSERRGLPKPSINQDELDFCISNLEFAAIDGEVGEEEFILFLENVSPQPLYFGEFHELPLQLVLVFYTAACTGGRNCSTEKPRISVDNAGASKAFLHIFCTSVKEVTLVQISFHFQYQVRLVGEKHNLSLASSGTIQNIEGQLIPHLEHATKLVLLTDLGCIGEAELGSDSRMLYDTRSDGGIWQEDQVHLAAKVQVGESQTRSDMPYHRQLYSQGKVDCDYSVHSSVQRWHEMQCLPVSKVATMDQPVDERIACLLVFSEVRVTAASLFQELTSLELRSTVSSALKAAILGEEFDNYLAAQNTNPL